MTKFSQIKEPQRQNLLNLYMEVLKIKSQEDHDLNRLGVRALLLANSAGLAAVITFIGVLVQTGKNHSAFANSLFLFLTGAGFAALVQLVLMIVSSQAVNALGTQLEHFIRDNLDLEQMQGWGLSRSGRIIVRVFYIASAIMFAAGVWAAFASLGSL